MFVVIFVLHCIWETPFGLNRAQRKKITVQTVQQKNGILSFYIYQEFFFWRNTYSVNLQVQVGVKKNLYLESYHMEKNSAHWFANRTRLDG